MTYSYWVQRSRQTEEGSEQREHTDVFECHGARSGEVYKLI